MFILDCDSSNDWSHPPITTLKHVKESQECASEKRVYYGKTNGPSSIAAPAGAATMGNIHQVKYPSYILNHTFSPQGNRMGFISAKYVWLLWDIFSPFLFFSVTAFILVKLICSIQVKNYSTVCLFHKHLYVRNCVKCLCCDLHLVMIQRSLQFCLEGVRLMNAMLILVQMTML